MVIPAHAIPPKATVTLLRCRTYIYKDIQFMKGEPKPVDQELAEELEALADEVKDTEGESILKPMFKVEYKTKKDGVTPVKAIGVKTLTTPIPKGKLQTSARPGGLKIRPRESA